LQAEVAASRKLLDAAHARFAEALALARSLGMRPLEARCLLGLVPLHHAEGRSDEARTTLGRAIEMFRSMGTEFWVAQAQRLGVAP
jgi:sugar phosphate isomerase/epimerase